MDLSAAGVRLQRRDAREQRGDHRSQLNELGCLLGDRRRLLGNSIVSPVAHHDSLNASAAFSWEAILHADTATDINQCAMEHIYLSVNGYELGAAAALLVTYRVGDMTPFKTTHCPRTPGPRSTMKPSASQSWPRTKPVCR